MNFVYKGGLPEFLRVVLLDLRIDCGLIYKKEHFLLQVLIFENCGPTGKTVFKKACAGKSSYLRLVHLSPKRKMEDTFQ